MHFDDMPAGPELDVLVAEEGWGNKRLSPEQLQRPDIGGE